MTSRRFLFLAGVQLEQNLLSIKKKDLMRRSHIVMLLMLLPAVAFSQSDTLSKKLDSLQVKADTGKQVNNINSASYNEYTKITFPVYFTLLWSDLKQQLTSPLRGNKQDWHRFAGLVAATAALSFADKPIQESVKKFTDSAKGIQKVSNYVTSFGGMYEAYTLIGLGAYGIIFKSEKVKTTTLLATQSYITAGVIETVLKELTKRERPYYIVPETGQPRGRFHGPFYGSGQSFKSFPSGHTTAAFAAATVYAMEYRKSIVIPIIAYSAATMVGISRITENKHWATDVLMGATLGYLCGRQVVNNYHRYAKLKSPKKAGSLTFNLQYNSGNIEPGLVYRF